MTTIIKQFLIWKVPKDCRSFKENCKDCTRCQTSNQILVTLSLKKWLYFQRTISRDFDSMLLYKFSCNACNSIYIGETKRHFIIRSLEHSGISLLTSKDLKYNDTYATAIRIHCHDNGHNCSINDFKIVGHASNKFHLRLEESLLISKDRPDIINVQKKSLPLYLFKWCCYEWRHSEFIVCYFFDFLIYLTNLLLFSTF